ncbi:hypothetical protein B296_00025029 [Ensete ventricosum]|uniref:D-isomer specific 2-hydroxyacid dehydrogenase NAD-binding domain-containing protein n=1 Tax=Ensete ventricosum TaxID=4639 RepID=A0A426XDN3_ENSVE|nr:hypothetical protein B296_00025029 [Ensete ventricosum]
MACPHPRSHVMAWGSEPQGRRATERPQVLLLRPPSSVFHEALSGRFQLLRPWESPLPFDRFLAAHAAGVRALLVIGPLLDALPALRFVVTTSSGVNHIDLAECARRGIAVANAGAIFSMDVADYAVGLLIDVLRRVSASDRYVRGGLWPRAGDYPLGSKVCLYSNSNGVFVPESLITIPLHLTTLSVVLAGFDREGELDTNPGDLAERVNSGTNPGDLIEKVNSSTNPGDLTEKVNSSTNLGDVTRADNPVKGLEALKVAKFITGAESPVKELKSLEVGKRMRVWPLGPELEVRMQAAWPRYSPGSSCDDAGLSFSAKECYTFYIPSYSRSRFVAMFRGELLIFGQRTSLDRPLRAEHLPFCECSFDSSVGSSVVDTCIKAMVGVAMCHPDVAPLTIKLAMNRSEVAKRRLEAFGCSISYFSKKLPYTYFPSVGDLAAESDVLVLSCALTEGTHHIINRDVMSALGKDGIIINVGRGALVDEAELVKRLMHKPAVPEELLCMDNVVL